MLPQVTPRLSPTTGKRISGPNSPNVFLSSKSSQNTVERFLSQFWLYYTTQQSKYSLHLLMTAARRMISGRVPHPIITFVRPSFFHLNLCSTITISLPLESYFLVARSMISPASIFSQLEILFSPLTMHLTHRCTPSSMMTS